MKRPAWTVAVMTINSGDTAWVLASAALVLLMTPGLALFYGGMVRAKSVLNMMMMSFGAMAIDQRRLGALGLQRGVRRLLARPHRQPLPALRALRPAGRRGRRCRAPDPGPGVRRLPGRVRHHHGGPDQRRDRRPGQVLHLDGLHRRLGDDRLLPGRPLGVRLRRLRGRQGRLDRQPAQGDRLRRRHGGAHQRRCRRPRAGAGPRQARRLRQGARCGRTT